MKEVIDIVKDISWVKTKDDPKIVFCPNSCSYKEHESFTASIKEEKETLEQIAKRVLTRLDVPYTKLVWINNEACFMIEGSDMSREICVVMSDNDDIYEEKGA